MDRIPRLPTLRLDRRLARRHDAGSRRIAVNLRMVLSSDAVRDIPLIHHDTESRADLPPDGKHLGDVWA
ncbi:MAG: hypothetical protein JSR60_15495 [Proteobacteria bacterium]|nr:hypothetical protein [Pseudomonadota bacterium]